MIIIANSNIAYRGLEAKFVNDKDAVIINHKDELTLSYLNEINPEYIFFPHWSYLIPSEIFETFSCVVFHMTDLPYGRGGSPLQNLIVRGHKTTKLTALKVVKELDAGPLYLKKQLSLSGSASEIFSRASLLMEIMISDIINQNIIPKPQEGEVTKFKRRKPKDSSILNLQELSKIYDYIRMLDAPGYPKAYLDFGEFRLELDEATLNNDEIKANVRIIKR